MNVIINDYVTLLNNIGRSFFNYSAGIFIQSSLLIILLLLIDLLLRKRVRATLRYWIWMLVFIKLVLPPTLCLPTGIGYWCGDYLSPESVLKQISAISEQESVEMPAERNYSELPVAPLIQQPVEYADITEPQNYKKYTEVSESSPAPAIIEKTTPVLDKSPALNPVTWQAVVFLIWLMGVLVISVLLIQRLLFVKGLIAQSKPVNGKLLEIMNQCRKQIGIRRDIKLRLSTNISSPAVCGMISPAILISPTLIKRLSRDKLKAVLIHELTHIKRGDLWINLVQTILQIVYFYNPFVWLANIIVRRIREQAVDEMVLVALGVEAKSYSNTLIDVAEMAFIKTSLSLRLIGVVESKKALRQRIKLILNRPMPKKAKLGILGLLVVVITGAVLLPMAKADKEVHSPEFSQPPVKLEAKRSYTTDEQKFSASLPNGVTVELIGVCEHPSQGKQWWRPDGSRLDKRPFEKLYGQLYPERDNVYELAIKIENPEHKQLNVINKDGGIFNLYSDKIWAGHVFSEGEKILNQSIGIAYGPWKTIVNANPKHVQGFGDLAFGKVFESDFDGTVGVTVTHTVGREKLDYRIIVVDRNNNIYTSARHSGIGGGSWMQTTVHFKDLQIDDIKEFQFQTRPYHWIEFKDVSLRPALVHDDLSNPPIPRLCDLRQGLIKGKEQLGFSAKHPRTSWQISKSDKRHNPKWYFRVNGKDYPLTLTGQFASTRREMTEGFCFPYLIRAQKKSLEGWKKPWPDGDYTLSLVVKNVVWLNPKGKRRFYKELATQPIEFKVKDGDYFSKTGQPLLESGSKTKNVSLQPNVKTDVQLEHEVGAWQNIGPAIPPDCNDTMVLTEHIELDSIGCDVERKVFINLLRDREKTKDRQYRFVMIEKDGTVIEPVGYKQFIIENKFWEKFTFEYHHCNQIKEFRLQKFPQNISQKASLPLTKPYAPNVDGKMMASAASGPHGRGALHFDGKGDYLYVPDSQSLWWGPEFTVEMWIKPESPEEELKNWPSWGLIGRGCTIGMKGRVKSRGFGITMNRFADDPNKLMIIYNTADDNGIYGVPYGGWDFDNWIHLSHVFRSKHYKPGYGYPLVIGRFITPESQFAGYIGEIRIWRGARSRDQISEYKNKPLTGNESGLVACWTFEQTEGQIAYDISPNRNHARLGSINGPDSADPRWIDLLAPLYEPQLQTDVQF